jgi:uncharacterized protein (TIGR02145 family)
LDISSTTQGFLPPRMTNVERNNIILPAIGLTIFNLTSGCLETWDGFQWYGPCSIQAANYPANTVFCNGIITKIIPVLNPTTGLTWMDRNLGASQKAISNNDQLSYGDLYQWGRRPDGHQCRTSTTIATLSSVDQPAHGSFITGSNAPFDWRSPQNANLWQGINGINNPCPNGYRLPTDTELNNERLSWSSNNVSGAFSSPLKWSLTGDRSSASGNLSGVGTGGYYWSSTVFGNNSVALFFDNANALMNINYSRASGLAIRCIKN